MRVTKLVAAVLGVPLIIGSFALTVVGGIAIAVPDDSGWVSTGPVRIGTGAAALVAQDIEVDFGGHFTDGSTFIGWEAIPTQLDVESRNGKEVFVGIASEADANSYLRGVALDRVLSFDHDPKLDHVRGSTTATPPGERDIWVASSTNGTLDWDVTDGEWAIVAMNADGSAGVDVSIEGAAKIPFLSAIGVVFMALGIVGMGGGSLLTYYGVRRVRDSQPQSPPPGLQPATAE